MTQPVWYTNALSLLEWREPVGHLHSCLFVAPFINSWLDATLVRDNPAAMRVVRGMDRLFSRFADFTKLKPVDKASGQYLLHKTHQRLRGLKP